MITVGILAKIRRMYFREKVPLREIARRTGLSRNTVRRWLRQTDAVEPKYPKRVSPSVIDDWAAQLTGWLRADSHRPKRDRRTARFMFEAIRAEGYAGSYGRVSAFVRRWHEEQAEAPRKKAFVPLAFEPGEAFQFDWSCEYAFVGGLRRRLEVAHVKLNSSRAFWLARAVEIVLKDSELMDAPGYCPEPALWMHAAHQCGYIQSRHATGHVLATA